MTALAMLVLALPLAAPAAEARLDKAKALLEAKDCDQLLLSFENAKPGSPDDVELGRVLAQAASGPCAQDKIVAFSLTGAARKLAPKDVEVLLASASAARSAGMAGEAETALDSAIAAAPADARPRLARAQLATDEGEPAVAIKVLGPVKSDPKAQELIALAEKARTDAEAAKKKLYRDEKTALDAGTKAKALDSRGSKSRARPEPADEPGGGQKDVLTDSYRLGAEHHSLSLHTRAGHTYSVRVEGHCYQRAREVQSSTSADLRFRCGKFVHGMAVTRLTRSTDGFDFVAEENGEDAEIWNADSHAAAVNCTGSISVSEK